VKNDVLFNMQMNIKASVHAPAMSMAIANLNVVCRYIQDYSNVERLYNINLYDIGDDSPRLIATNAEPI
jgi:hypothetical protein